MEEPTVSFGRILLLLAVFILLLLGSTVFIHYFIVNPFYYHLTYDYTESSEFRQMKLTNEEWDGLLKMSKDNKIALGEVFSLYMISHSAAQTITSASISYTELMTLKSTIQKIKYSEYQKAAKAYQALLDCITCFPVVYHTDHLFTVCYEDSWLMPRSYGGERSHEGCDLFCSREDVQTGTIPIVSMCDGVVEAVGWLPLGGYRVGIRSKTGVYFYYAHLASYAGNLAVGKEVSAGETIGYMGDTGYSEIEGTTGNFPMHLHLGIYFQTEHYPEMAINPYAWLYYAKLKHVLTARYPLQIGE